MKQSISHSQNPTKVLFLAWGYSIHARRRIQIFLDDPSFKVAVVSTHAYNFPGAKNIILEGIPSETNHPDKINSSATNSFLQNVRKKIDILRHILDPRPFIIFYRILSSEGKKSWGGHLLALLSFFSIPRQRYRMLNDLKILRSSIREFKPDVIFLQTLIYPCYLALFLPSSIPMIITFWNGDILWWTQWDGIERLVKKQLVRKGTQRAKAITVNSQDAYNVCLQYGVEESKVHLIHYPGVDLDRFKPSDKNTARDDLNITSRYVILSPRGLGEYLNTEIILEAASLVLKKHPDTLFIFLSGSNTEIIRHQDIALKLGISSQCRWEGYVSWENMPLYYNAADVMVSISSQDSLPNCMLEAMACNLPVIMGDIPQIRKWITDRDNGFLIPPLDVEALANTISFILNNQAQNIAITQKNAHLVSQEFDSRVCSDKMRYLTHQIANNKHISIGGSNNGKA